jgi:asparagine synthase (glutamine-hydrolysing)
MQPDEFSSALAETLATTLPRYVAGDQAIGFSITGGLDTRMILAALPASRRNIRCYTFGGLSGETLDQQIGRNVAGLCGLEHQSLRITRHWLESFPEYVDRTVWITDGAAGATTAHEIFLTGLGRALGLVRLTGNFGSEVLRGMSTLKPWAPSQGFIAREFEPPYAAAKAPLADLHPISRAVFGEVPYHLFGPLAAGRSQVAFRTPYMDNDVVSLAYRSPDAGTISPRASLEAIDRLKPQLARIPTDRGVSLRSGGIRAAAIGALEAVRFKLDYLDKEGLPGHLRLLDPLLALLRRTPMLGKHKYLSYRTWFQRELYGYLSTAVTGTTALGEYIDITALSVLADEHASGRQNRLREINAVLTLSAVERLMFRNSSSAIAPD